MANIDQLDLKKYNDISAQYGILKDQLHLGKSFDDFKAAIQEGNLNKIDDNLKRLNQLRQDFMNSNNAATLSEAEKTAVHKIEDLTKTRANLTDLQNEVRGQSDKAKEATQPDEKDAEKTNEEVESTENKEETFVDKSINRADKNKRYIAGGAAVIAGVSRLWGKVAGDTGSKTPGIWQWMKRGLFAGAAALGIGWGVKNRDKLKEAWGRATDPVGKTKEKAEEVVDEAKKKVGEAAESAKESVKDAADAAATAVGGGDLIDDSKSDTDPNNPNNQRALPDEKEREALMMAQQVVMLDEYSRPYILGSDGKRFYPKIKQQFVGVENGPAMMQQTLGATTFYKMQLLKDYVDIWSMQAQKIAATRNNLNSNWGRDEGKLIKGDAESVTNRYYSHMMAEILKNTQTSEYQNLSEGQKRGSNNLIALKYMNLIFKDINLSEDDRETIFGGSNDNIQSKISGFTGKSKGEFEAARLSIYQLMRKDTGENFKDIIGLGGGNSDGVKDNLQDVLLDRPDYAKLKAALVKDGKIMSLLATSNGQAQIDQIKNQLIGIGLNQDDAQELTEDVIEEHKDIQINHEKRRTEYKQYLNAAFNDFKSEESKQDLIKFVQAKYNRSGLSYEQAHEVALDGLIKDAIAASTLMYLKDECFFYLLRDKKAVAGEEELLGSILGTGSKGIFADKYMDWVVEGGVNIALCLIPMGAGVVAAKVATGAVRGASIVKNATSLNTARSAATWSQKATRLGFITAEAAIGGSAMYAGSLAVQSAIDSHLSFFEGWSNKELVKNMAMWGILGNLTKVLGRLNIPKIPQNGIVSPEILGMTGQILAEGSAMTAVNMGVDQMRDGEAHWSWGEFLQGLILIAAFKSAGKMVELKPGESIYVKKIKDKLSLWKGKKSAPEAQPEPVLENGFARPTVSVETKAEVAKKIEGLQKGEYLEYQGIGIRKNMDGTYSRFKADTETNPDGSRNGYNDKPLKAKTAQEAVEEVDALLQPKVAPVTKTGEQQNQSNQQNTSTEQANKTGKSKVEQLLAKSTLSKNDLQNYFEKSGILRKVFGSSNGYEMRLGNERIKVSYDATLNKIEYKRFDSKGNSWEPIKENQIPFAEEKMFEYLNARMYHLGISKKPLSPDSWHNIQTRLKNLSLQGGDIGKQATIWLKESAKYKTPVVGDLIAIFEQKAVFGDYGRWYSSLTKNMFGAGKLGDLKFGTISTPLSIAKSQTLFTLFAVGHAVLSEEQDGIDATKNIIIQRICWPVGAFLEGKDLAVDAKDNLTGIINDIVEDIPLVGDSLKIS